jgi:hypothetical protein
VLASSRGGSTENVGVEAGGHALLGLRQPAGRRGRRGRSALGAAVVLFGIAR